MKAGESHSTPRAPGSDLGEAHPSDGGGARL